MRVGVGGGACNADYNNKLKHVAYIVHVYKCVYIRAKIWTIISIKDFQGVSD